MKIKKTNNLPGLHYITNIIINNVWFNTCNNSSHFHRDIKIFELITLHFHNSIILYFSERKVVYLLHKQSATTKSVLFITICLLLPPSQIKIRHISRLIHLFLWWKASWTGQLVKAGHRCPYSFTTPKAYTLPALELKSPAPALALAALALETETQHSNNSRYIYPDEFCTDITPTNNNIALCTVSIN